MGSSAAPNLVSENIRQGATMLQCTFQDGADPGMDRMLGYLKSRKELRLLGTEPGQELILHRADE